MEHREIMIYILKFMLLFMVGTVAGWLIEVVWRRFFGKARRWINPGFLNGPWLPLYGFGTIILYGLCQIGLPLYLNAAMFFVVLTILEYIAGVIFTKYFNIQLWDYNNNWGNFQGIICPLYSVLWMLLGLFFNAVLFPLLQRDISFLLNNLEFSFFVGVYAGVFSVDVWHSFNLAHRIKQTLKESEERIAVDLERLKLELRDRVENGIKNRTHFLLPFHGELGASLVERLKSHDYVLLKKMRKR